ncbi:RNA-directed DNA polymerase, eukaryota [Tanacetum coccineum]
MWSENTFKRIASIWGTLIHVEDQEEVCKVFCVRAKEISGWVPNFVEENEEKTDMKDEINGEEFIVVPDSEFEEEIPKTKDEDVSVRQEEANSEDPFKIYDLLNKKEDVNNKNANEENSLKFPLGFTPNDTKEATVEYPNKSNESKRMSGEDFHIIQEEESDFGAKKYCAKKKAKEDVAQSMCSGHFQKARTPRSGGSILQLMDDMVKSCWGNFAFDYVYSDSVGNSGGILCVWDPKSFKKLNVMVSDYFVIIRGVWMLNGKNLIIISVYVPQELTEKKMLWDYLSSVTENWNGKVVIMGGFNEVRKKAELFGSVFNVQGANAFNTFISNAGLEEVPLGGCFFTWCHKSATKMSKLDRFLIYKSLISSCPNIFVVSLERYLFDHRMILMLESHYDYGPVPFRFFHYWFDMEGFDKLVEDSYKEAPVVDINAMIKMMKKLKYLKEKIRGWNKKNKGVFRNNMCNLKNELAELDLVIDKGEGDVDVVNKRTNVIKTLQELEKLQSLKLAQKTKIKWAIKGDENSKYYHGILNKKKSQLAIRGILVDGNWIKSPDLVKRKFLSHFKKRFKKPIETRLHIDLNFPSKLTSDQRNDLECEVTKDEIKKAVWDCGIEKSPVYTYRSKEWWTHWNEASIDIIVHVLECFHRASGLRINMSKSKLLGISVDADKSWKETVEGTVARLSKWKMKTLSIGGRLTLIKSVLCSMSICHMSLFKVPMKVLQRMESIRSHFFNGVDLVGKKPIWVKWKNVLPSKDKGGLGVSSLFALHRALMFKWVWRFFTQSSSLWTRVIKAIHGGDGKIGKKAKSSFPSIWLDIVHEVEMFKEQGTDLVNFIHKKLGNRTNTLFWEEPWHEGSVFKNLYPRLYALELSKNIDVALKMNHSNLVYSFRREPRKLLDDKMLPKITSKTCWIKAMPIKVNVHAWKVKIDCLQTRINISRRGMEIESIICPMCGEAAESSRHISFICRITREVLRKISRWWDVSYSDLSSYEDWLEWILSLWRSVKHKQFFGGVCYAMWWHIWSFHNNVFSTRSFLQRR